MTQQYVEQAGLHKSAESNVDVVVSVHGIVVRSNGKIYPSYNLDERIVNRTFESTLTEGICRIISLSGLRHFTFSKKYIDTY